MPMTLLDKWNGGKKAFFSALLGALLGALPVAIAVGEYKGKVDTIDRNLTQHLEKYTPEIGSDYQKTKTEVAVQKEQIANLQHSLDDIKKQNETIIKLMRSR